MGIGTRILSRLKNVRMSVTEEEYEGSSRRSRETGRSPSVEALGS